MKFCWLVAIGNALMVVDSSSDADIHISSSVIVVLSVLNWEVFFWEKMYANCWQSSIADIHISSSAIVVLS